MSGAGRVIVASFPTPVPIGGVAVQVDMVGALGRLGVDAVRWLPREPTDDDWPYPSVPIISGMTTTVGPDDVLVLPEIAVHPRADLAHGANKVIYNQNHFLTLASWSDTVPPYSSWSPRPHVWTVSHEARDVLSALTGSEVRLVPPRVDYQMFSPAEKQPGTAAIMPRKRPRQAEVLVRLLTTPVGETPLDVRLLDGLPSRAVADALASISTFVALSRTEGLGLPVQEALASGCHVVGYSGGGGRELFDAPSAHLIPDDCVTDLVQRTRELATGEPNGSPANRRWVTEHYSHQAADRALMDALSAARSGARRATATTARHPETAFEHLPPDFFTAI